MALTWKVYFDWTTAGEFDTSRNDALNMISYSVSRGRHQFIKENGEGLERVSPGYCQIKLDNSTGVYDPYNTSSVLYPHVEPGRYLRLSVIDYGDDDDAYYTKSLLHFEGTDGSTTITDEDVRSWTAHNGAKISTDYAVFGSSSLRLSSVTDVSTDYIETPQSSDLHLGTNDWTLNFWFYLALTGTELEYLYGDSVTFFQQNGANGSFTIGYDTISGGSIFSVYLNTTTPAQNTSAIIPNMSFYQETWHHVEIARHENELLFFIDGELQHTLSFPYDIAIDAPTRISGGIFGGIYYIDEFRLLNGRAEHTFSFQPPEAPYILPEIVSETRFTGQIESIEKIGDVRNPQVIITAYDGIKHLQNMKLSTTIRAGSTTEKTGAQMAYMSTSAEYPSIYGTSSIATGNGIINYCWANERSAYEVMNDISDAEAGLFCVRADGSIMFRSRDTQAAVDTLDQSIMLKDILLTSPYKLNRNIARVYVYDKSKPSVSAVKLWKLNDVPLVSTAAGLTVWGRFTYNGDSCLGYDMVTPADTTDFLMNSKADGTGTDRTSKWNVTTTYFGEVSKNVISSDGALNNHYCTLLRNRGKPIVSDESTYRVYDHSGTAAERLLTIDNPFIQTNWESLFYDNFMEELTGVTLRLPIFQLEAQSLHQFGIDVFDVVHLHISKYGIDGDYLIGGIDEEWLTDNGQAVRTTFYTEPHLIVDIPPVLGDEGTS